MFALTLLPFDQTIAILAFLFGFSIYKGSKLALNHPDKAVNCYKLIRMFLKK
jgi:hypothetical protein